MGRSGSRRSESCDGRARLPSRLIEAIDRFEQYRRHLPHAATA
jgi:hypothetical protein